VNVHRECWQLDKDIEASDYAARIMLLNLSITGAPLPVQVYRFRVKAISQNVRLLGCIYKTCKNCDKCRMDNCCCSIRLVAPKKNLWKGKKGTSLFITLQH
jgi:hypothetical protein